MSEIGAGARAAEWSNPLAGFQTLMPYRVQDILLVSSLYDSFTLQEDGRLDERVQDEFRELSPYQTPGLRHVSLASEALALARSDRRFNLIVTSPHPADMDATALARRVKEAGLDVPVVVLAFDNNERKSFAASHDLSQIERVFLWQGNARILFAIVKSVEDSRNVAFDTEAAGVPVILVVEDNVRYYSSFLPVIYTELISQSHRLISEGVNLTHKLLRMRARPKILLAETLERAWELFSLYRPYMLGVISDIEFPAGGVTTPEAGFTLVRRVREVAPDLPILLQSSREKFAQRAYEEGARFLRKYSDTLLADLGRFMVEHFAFGDFVFRLPDGTEVARASDLKELEQKLSSVPVESIGYHGERNHFSDWFVARTEFALARRLRPRKVSEFATLEDLRHDLMESIAEYRREQNEALVADFDRQTFDARSPFFSRIGGGSIGGKARGLAFVRYLLSYHGVARRFPGVRLTVPSAVVLATDCFDRFLAENELNDFAIGSQDDEATTARFLASPLPEDVVEDLRAFLAEVRWPLAVRSSSLLEDSQYQPFTGVYETYMVPNNAPSLEARLGQLMNAIRRVYASMFSVHAKSYLHATPYRLEEEKMAVVIQRVVGSERGSRYYPDFSGVARSYNFYPSPPLHSEDGIAAVVLGLGRGVVAGGRCLLFSPHHPRHLLHFSTVDEILANSQREFWALELGTRDDADSDAGLRESQFRLDAAEKDGVLFALGSTYSSENHAIYDGLSRPGVRLVTFAPILKHGLFPLPDLLSLLLEIGVHGMARPVEIEFAACLSDEADRPQEFGVLQLRPLVLSREQEQLDASEPDLERLVCHSPRVMGNGRVDDLRDVVVVDFDRFDRAQSVAVAGEVGRFNAELAARGVPYLLIGVGRWGTNDAWLGIPVAWNQISGARVIVEAGFRDFRVTPSQGSHFFQNLSTFEVGYFTVNAESGEGFVDWEWLGEQSSESERGVVRHLRFDEPLVVKMDGRKNEGIIYKPGRLPA